MMRFHALLELWKIARRVVGLTQERTVGAPQPCSNLGLPFGENTTYLTAEMSAGDSGARARWKTTSTHLRLAAHHSAQWRAGADMI